MITKGGLGYNRAMKKKDPHAVVLGRKGGLVGGLARTPAKIAAVRANGAKGGRPAAKRRTRAGKSEARHAR